LTAARRFDRLRHRRFVIGTMPVGWIREDDVERLRRWPAIFTIAADAVLLNPSLGTLEGRTDALAEVIQTLADNGRITGWRNEIFAIRNRFDDPPLAFIERAASRFFGTMTYAVHANGLIASAGTSAAVNADDGSTAPTLWIARRSFSKAVDPGMLDTLVGGGIGWGWNIEDTLIKECWEESGVPAELARQARTGRTLHILAEIEQGTQAEQLFIYDVTLPADFQPSAEDGEVAEHLRMSVDETLLAVASGAMTVDASLATLDCALRRGWLSVASLPGFIQIASQPVFI
jgi:hypothetical protein